MLELALAADPRRLAARPAYRELLAKQRERGVVVMVRTVEWTPVIR